MVTAWAYMLFKINANFSRLETFYAIKIGTCRIERKVISGQYFLDAKRNGDGSYKETCTKVVDF